MKKEEFSQKRKEFRDKNVEELLELLASENLQTRFFAEMALRDISGTWLNFQPASSQEKRIEAIEEWREWFWEREGTFKKKFKWGKRFYREKGFISDKYFK